MTRRERIDRAEEAKAEVEGAVLGDVRLTRRLERLAESLASRPDRSLPDVAQDDSSLEAFYRFLSNEKVVPEAILAPHIEQTRLRASELDRALVIFDTTELRFGGEREELGYLTHEKGRGLLAHIGLAVNPLTREPLGVLSCETLVRRGTKKHRQYAGKAADSESLRWHRGVERLHGLLAEAICVMDREADIFSLVATMSARSQQFVIRAAQNRLTREGPLWDLLDDTELVTTREVDLPARQAPGRKAAAKRHPARTRHTATLELRARRVQLQRPNRLKNDPLHGNAAAVPLNLVHVVERNPPAGDEPVEWALLTSLPVESETDVTFVVDAYTARWVIEEFFKALKSGCAIERRQIESARGIINILAVSLPIAWLLLRLRHLSRDQPDQTASGIISSQMMTCLRALNLKRTQRRLPAHPTCRELTWAIAGLGGHIKNNGEPGHIVLGRGLARLLAATEAVDALQSFENM